MRIINHSIYRIKAYKGHSVVLVVGVKPNMDTDADCNDHLHFGCDIREIEGEGRE